eukprot:TRINITY_DN3997_c0_g1_i1.p1 TRINITY_DN3997_c0_g1~~TRINITY_DN3997_c0_g1_i1.p1  ORF type:complete len:141 (+),score=11.82 TRINITY_DN3997_c0_g1_i1:81-503(+)
MQQLIRYICLATLLLCVSTVFADSNHQHEARNLGNATGACNDTQDLNAFHTANSTFHASLQKCAEKCFGGVSCSTSCIASTIGLTNACAACFGTDVGCTAENCTADCLNPNSSACLQCSEKYCMPALLACAGVPQNDIPN